MARISTYTSAATVSKSDILLGSKITGTSVITKNFSVGDVLNLVGEGTLNTIPMWTPDGETLGDSPLRIETTGAGLNKAILSNADRFIIDKLSTSTSGDPEYLITQDSVFKFSMGWDDDGAGFGYLYNWAGDGIRLGAAGNNPVLEIITAGSPQVEISGDLLVTEDADVGEILTVGSNIVAGGNIIKKWYTLDTNNHWIDGSIGEEYYYFTNTSSVWTNAAHTTQSITGLNLGITTSAFVSSTSTPKGFLNLKGLGQGDIGGYNNIWLVAGDSITTASQINSRLQVGFNQFVPDLTNTDSLYVNGSGRFTGSLISDDIQVISMTEHADNAAAILAGLAVGVLYRTGDLLKIVH